MGPTLHRLWCCCRHPPERRLRNGCRACSNGHANRLVIWNFSAASCPTLGRTAQRQAQIARKMPRPRENHRGMLKDADYSDKMRSRPTVSVIIANHNGGAHLGDAIKSVQKQTLRNIEIIVSDSLGRL